MQGEDETKLERGLRELDVGLLDGITWPEYVWEWLRSVDSPLATFHDPAQVMLPGAQSRSSCLIGSARYNCLCGCGCVADAVGHIACTGCIPPMRMQWDVMQPCHWKSVARLFIMSQITLRPWHVVREAKKTASCRSRHPHTPQC